VIFAVTAGDFIDHPHREQAGRIVLDGIRPQHVTPEPGSD
jgi:hypothetical protein